MMDQPHLVRARGEDKRLEFEILGYFKKGHGMVAIGCNRKEIKMTQFEHKKRKNLKKWNYH